MHCIVLNSPDGLFDGKPRWQIWRSVEILGYHHAKKEVHILFGLFIENLVSDTSFLGVLHRGEVECRLLQPWPFPLHVDEERNEVVPRALAHFYGKGFEEREGRVYHVGSLTPWGEWRDVPRDKREEVIPWPTEDCPDLAFGQVLPPDCKIPRPKFCAPPFTTWKLGPFPRRALYLVAFSLVFRGETYTDLVERGSTFSVDGPNRLLAAIKYRDLFNLPAEEKTAWDQALYDFESRDKRLVSDSYDVVILGSGLADDVTVAKDTECSNGIYHAPRDASQEVDTSGCYQRFVTTDDDFTLPLVFSQAAPKRRTSALV